MEIVTKRKMANISGKETGLDRPPESPDAKKIDDAINIRFSDITALRVDDVNLEIELNTGVTSFYRSLDSHDALRFQRIVNTAMQLEEEVQNQEVPVVQRLFPRLFQESPNFPEELQKACEHIMECIGETKSQACCIKGPMACAFGCIFRDQVMEEWGTSEVMKMLQNRFIYIWSDAVIAAAEQKETSVFIARMMLYLVRLIVVLGEQVNTMTEMLKDACIDFCNAKGPKALVHEAQIMKMYVTPLRSMPPHFDKIFDAVVVCISAVVVGGSQVGVDEVVAATAKLMEMTGKACELEAIDALDNALSAIVGDMFRKMQTRRYEEKFQFVFAMWKFHESS